VILSNLCDSHIEDMGSSSLTIQPTRKWAQPGAHNLTVYFDSRCFQRTWITPIIHKGLANCNLSICIVWLPVLNTLRLKLSYLLINICKECKYLCLSKMSYSQVKESPLILRWITLNWTGICVMHSEERSLLQYQMAISGNSTRLISPTEGNNCALCTAWLIICLISQP